MSLWLFKTEPSEYSYADLARDKRVVWEGVSSNAALHLRRNPAGASIAMDLDLPRPGPVDVRLLDLAGRIVAERHIDVAAAGRQPLEIVPSARVKPGLYFVRVTSPAGVATGRVTFLR